MRGRGEAARGPDLADHAKAGPRIRRMRNAGSLDMRAFSSGRNENSGSGPELPSGEKGNHRAHAVAGKGRPRLLGVPVHAADQRLSAPRTAPRPGSSRRIPRRGPAVESPAKSKRCTSSSGAPLSKVGRRPKLATPSRDCRPGPTGPRRCRGAGDNRRRAQVGGRIAERSPALVAATDLRAHEPAIAEEPVGGATSPSSRAARIALDEPDAAGLRRPRAPRCSQPVGPTQFFQDRGRALAAAAEMEVVADDNAGGNRASPSKTTGRTPPPRAQARAPSKRSTTRREAEPRRSASFTGSGVRRNSRLPSGFRKVRGWGSKVSTRPGRCRRPAAWRTYASNA